jgi:ABC-type phosphate transport system substrate-binding protein
LRRKQNHSLVVLGSVAIAALLFGALAARSVAAAAEDQSFIVIVNPSNSMTSTSSEFLSQVFFKRTTRWHNGEAIHPVDQLQESATRRGFSDRVLKRSIAAVRNYWQQRIFSGRDLPPPELDSDDAVVAYVAKTPGAIGYVSGSAKHERIKVLALE